MKLSKYVALAKRGYCKVIHVQRHLAGPEMCDL